MLAILKVRQSSFINEIQEKKKVLNKQVLYYMVSNPMKRSRGRARRALEEVVKGDLNMT